ncbi:hypothetical protein VNO77_44261 [Canavalia gladiata]|uniref:Uncharacterized protein n=1 Tax=Canavalia gladiata TaxID=3824 RepID=A0AAN9JVL7_CANGL
MHVLRSRWRLSRQAMVHWAQRLFGVMGLELNPKANGHALHGAYINHELSFSSPIPTNDVGSQSQIWRPLQGPLFPHGFAGVMHDRCEAFLLT